MFSSFVAATPIRQVIEQKKTKVFSLGVTVGFRVQTESLVVPLDLYTKQLQTSAGNGVCTKLADGRRDSTLKLS